MMFVLLLLIANIILLIVYLAILCTIRNSLMLDKDNEHLYGKLRDVELITTTQESIVLELNCAKGIVFCDNETYLARYF